MRKKGLMINSGMAASAPVTQTFRFHSLALPHTVSSPEYNACAYTQKIVKFHRMMMPRGYTLIHYGHEESDLPATEHVVVTDNAVLRQAYGDHDWRRHEFKHNTGDFANQEFIRRTIPEVLKRAQRGDFLLCWWGIGHKAIADAVASLGVIAVEPGIGYTSGHFSQWRAYESHAVRNTVEGSVTPQRWYSHVIPNYFDPTEFTYREEKEPWILYLGRVVQCKGVVTCIQAAAAAGVNIKVAGQGRLTDIGYAETPAHVEQLGYANVEMRRDLMSRASALIIASQYNEPFGGVQVEALLSGTPIITPFFGAFAEVNQDGVTGFHCHTLREFKNAIEKRDTISPRACRERGMQYSLEAVAPLFERWFANIAEVYSGKGWMATD